MIYLIKLLVTILVVYKFILYIISEIKNYKKLTKKEKDKFKFLILIFNIPIFFFFGDYYNIFSYIFPDFKNITKEYDWLSFIGTYSSAFLSSILLILITEKDRNENTRILQESQRPYLDVSYMIIEEDHFEENKGNVTTFDHGNDEDRKVKKKKILTLCIENSGASVAIIDVNKTQIELNYIKNGKNKVEKFNLNSVVKRFSLKSGNTLYIKFIKNELYDESGILLKNSQILSSTIYYKDLFDKKYFDECKLDEHLNVLHDNEKINE